jgi:hypothetical protein
MPEHPWTAVLADENCLRSSMSRASRWYDSHCPIRCSRHHRRPRRRSVCANRAVGVDLIAEADPNLLGDVVHLIVARENSSFVVRDIRRSRSTNHGSATMAAVCGGGATVIPNNPAPQRKHF